MFTQGYGQIPGRWEEIERVCYDSPKEQPGDKMTHRAGLILRGYMKRRSGVLRAMFRFVAVLFVAVVAGLFSAEVNR